MSQKGGGGGGRRGEQNPVKSVHFLSLRKTPKPGSRMSKNDLHGIWGGMGRRGEAKVKIVYWTDRQKDPSPVS